MWFLITFLILPCAVSKSVAILTSNHFFWQSLAFLRLVIEIKRMYLSLQISYADWSFNYLQKIASNEVIKVTRWPLTPLRWHQYTTQNTLMRTVSTIHWKHVLITMRFCCYVKLDSSTKRIFIKKRLQCPVYGKHYNTEFITLSRLNALVHPMFISNNKHNIIDSIRRTGNMCSSLHTWHT